MKSKNLKDKVIRVKRVINVYLNDEDELSYEINIDNIPSNEDDQLMYDSYMVNKEQMKKLNVLLEKKVDCDFKKYAYYIECYQTLLL